AVRQLPKAYNPNTLAQLAEQGPPPDLPDDSMFVRDMSDDPGFDLFTRLEFATDYEAEVMANEQSVPRDRDLARTLRALLQEMVVGGDNVPYKAGELAEALEAAFEWRRHMVRRHLCSRVVRRVTIKGKAWVRGNMPAGVRAPFSVKHAPFVPSFEVVWEAMQLEAG
ncbi:hypothetical protein HaLaN_07990, partial [Haematococcus lacustris]